MKLRSIEIILPDPSAAAEFMTGIWGMADAGTRGATRYVRGSGEFPYLVAFDQGDEAVRSVTYVCTDDELARVREGAARQGLATADVTSGDPGGGRGVVVRLPEGELFRFLVGAETVARIEGRDLPVQLTHVVLNSADAEASSTMVEDALGFRVSDRTKGMVFVRCNDSHHSTAFARAGISSLNHIAFEMQDLDAVMRGIGRLRDNAMAPAWGPGRHGPGANVFAYYVAPFGPVIEFSTAVDKVADDYRAGEPDDWTWPENRIDQWGMSDKDFAGLRKAEERFRFVPLPTPAA